MHASEQELTRFERTKLYRAYGVGFIANVTLEADLEDYSHTSAFCDTALCVCLYQTLNCFQCNVKLL